MKEFHFSLNFFFFYEKNADDVTQKKEEEREREEEKSYIALLINLDFIFHIYFSHHFDLYCIIALKILLNIFHFLSRFHLIVHLLY